MTKLPNGEKYYIALKDGGYLSEGLVEESLQSASCQALLEKIGYKEVKTIVGGHKKIISDIYLSSDVAAKNKGHDFVYSYYNNIEKSDASCIAYRPETDEMAVKLKDGEVFFKEDFATQNLLKEHAMMLCGVSDKELCENEFVTNGIAAGDLWLESYYSDQLEA